MSDLQALCGRPEQMHICRPFTVQLDGHDWTIATNGQAMLMLRDHGEKFEVGSMPADVVRGAALDVVGPSLGAVPYAELARLLQSESSVPCAICAGTGELTCECCGTPDVRCQACGGHGEREPDASWGEFLGLKMNRVLLWRYLSAVSAATVVVHPATSQTLPVMLAAPDDSWRIVVMPGRPDAHVAIEWSLPEEMITGSATPLTKGGEA